MFNICVYVYSNFPSSKLKRVLVVGVRGLTHWVCHIKICLFYGLNPKSRNIEESNLFKVFYSIQLRIVYNEIW